MLKPGQNVTMDNTDMVLDSYLDVVAKGIKKDKMNLDIFTDGVETLTSTGMLKSKPMTWSTTTLPSSQMIRCEPNCFHCGRH